MPINQLPPYYIDTNNIHTWIVDIFDSPFGLPCICGDQTEGKVLSIVRPYITRICQRQDEPCKIEISFHLGTANGVYFYQQGLSGFSVDTTNGKDGNWFELRPDIYDARHNPSLNNTLLASTNSVDATWAFAMFDPSNPMHTTQDPCIVNWANLGIPIHTFVFDMCDHISTWLSEPKVAFRLSFSKSQIAPKRKIGCGVPFIGQ